MKDKIQKAISNNNDLYEEIFSHHQIKFHRARSVCYCLEKTPPLYSNLVTISKDWEPDEIFANIDFNYENEGWDEWSIKDSFAVLDLNKYGFTKLFDARWMYLEAAKFSAMRKRSGLRCELIKNESALAMWRLAWDSDEQLGREIFNSRLLDNPKVYFVGGYADDRIISGCFVNRTEDFLGLSNFFAPGGKIDYLSDMVSFIFNSIERTDIVGYERKKLVADLSVLGFEDTGKLSVWLKKKTL